MAVRIDQIPTFDELNQLVGMDRSMSFDRYFGSMRLTDSQKRQRIELAERLEDEFVYCLALLYYSYPDINEGLVKEIEQRYEDALKDIGVIAKDAKRIVLDASGEIRKDYELQAETFAANTVDATLNHKDDPYFYSEDRARLLAEGEASTIFNMIDYDAAELAGLTYKVWLTAGDNHVRETHAELEGVVKHIDEPFDVGMEQMMFPRDGSLGAGAEEISNCRCSVEYLEIGAALMGWESGAKTKAPLDYLAELYGDYDLDFLDELF